MGITIHFNQSVLTFHDTHSWRGGSNIFQGFTISKNFLSLYLTRTNLCSILFWDVTPCVKRLRGQYSKSNDITQGVRESPYINHQGDMIQQGPVGDCWVMSPWWLTRSHIDSFSVDVLKMRIGTWLDPYYCTYNVSYFGHLQICHMSHIWHTSELLHRYTLRYSIDCVNETQISLSWTWEHIWQKYLLCQGSRFHRGVLRSLNGVWFKVMCTHYIFYFRIHQHCTHGVSDISGLCVRSWLSGN